MYWKWVIGVGCLLLCLNAPHAFAGESMGENHQPKAPTYRNGYGRVVQRGPYAPPPVHYRLRSTPQTYRAWQKKNYWDDFENLLRSPLYRESDLEYMLRTF